MIKSARVDVGRIVLNVREAGSGYPLILLHGITANAAIWDPVTALLASASLRVISVDQRGHGRSDKPVDGYGAHDYAEDVLALAATLGRPAIVVGHSLGARNAVVAGQLRPDLVAGVVAIEFTPFIEAEVFASLETRVRGGDQQFASVTRVEEYVRDRYKLLPDDAVHRRAHFGYQTDGDGFRALADPAAMNATARGLREDFEPAVREIQVPLLMMRGALSSLVSETAWSRTLALRPDIQSLVVDGADHYIPEEQPNVVSAAIMEFAEQVISDGAVH